MKHITLIRKKYSKFIEELVEFINDLSINMFYTSFWLVSVCRIQYKKNCFFFKEYLLPLSSLFKLYHKTDCHRFDEYKAIVELLRDPNQTQGTKKNIPWVFFQEHTHQLIETFSRGSYNSEELDLDILFYF